MVRYVPDRAAVKVQYYVLCIYCSSAKSLQAEERNLQFLEQCVTVASDKRFQGQSGAAATTLCFPGSRSIYCTEIFMWPGSRHKRDRISAGAWTELLFTVWTNATFRCVFGQSILNYSRSSEGRKWPSGHCRWDLSLSQSLHKSHIYAFLWNFSRALQSHVKASWQCLTKQEQKTASCQKAEIETGWTWDGEMWGAALTAARRAGGGHACCCQTSSPSYSLALQREQKQEAGSSTATTAKAFVSQPTATARLRSPWELSRVLQLADNCSYMSQFYPGHAQVPFLHCPWKDFMTLKLSLHVWAWVLLLMGTGFSSSFLPFCRMTRGH